MNEKPYDIYRDSYLRYLGYANEVGEAFQPIVKPIVVQASYVLSTGYVIADTVDKAYKKYRKGENIKGIAITATDVFIWQMLASVIISGYVVNRVTWGTGQLLLMAKMKDTVVKTVPIIAGLSSIPIIVHPIDDFTDFIMDNTYRKWIPK